MGSRLKLQSLLEELLGSKNVYFQPPTNLNMSYPAIKYSTDDIDAKKADDTAYIITKRYEVIVISPKPDNPVIEKLLSLPMCSYDRQYKADNLYHDVLTLYY